VQVIKKGCQRIIQFEAKRVVICLGVEFVPVGVPVPAVMGHQHKTGTGFGLQQLTRQQTAVAER
jgi:hypothetical protein